jgi:glycosyltransferase involved in cell wall biosynthesis
MAGLIVHDWLERRGGAEVVLDGMLDAFPEAALFGLWDDSGSRFSERTTVQESWLARTPLRRHKALALPLMPFVWRDVQPERPAEWMLVSSNAFAHQARIRRHPDLPKFVYTHSPARYIWDPELDQRSSDRALAAVRPLFRQIDRAAVDQRASFAANSAFVRDRITRTWGVDSFVLHPPVPVEDIQAVPNWAEALSASERGQFESLPREFVLGVSRFVPYKRLDAVLRFGAAAGLPVVLAGAGPDEARLRSLADQLGAHAHFFIAPSTSLIRALYQRALALLFLGIEDFGIVPVEAMAAGGRVIVNRVGGAAETVVDGVSGAHVTPVDDQEIRVALEALTRADVAVAASARAKMFGHERFVVALREWVTPGRARGGTHG